ncbi:3-deoxy-D-manno-octulosonic acid transferase [Fusobacterium sp. PH5-44]|uniref:3-deoxy-D-manno-octulosonic acid transferase n=1 Tax=unclassified Fusobacterium TaxID=2648384 RepID=UPI003D253C8C
MVYDIFRRIIMIFFRIYTLFSKDKQEFFNKRIGQNYSSLSEEDYIWVHCASVGEINLSETFVRLLSQKYEIKILLTCVTDTGMEIAKNKYKESKKIELFYFPLDDKKEIKKILMKINLKMLILVETEIWPNLINSAKDYKIIIINGRISNRSYKRYKKIKFLIRGLLEKIDRFYMQSKEDANKIIDIGANSDKVEVIGNLKFDVKMKRYSKEELDQYKQELGITNEKVFVAGSIRSGEYEIVLEALKEIENLIIILVPRHLDKIKMTEKLLSDKGYTYKKYSDIKISGNIPNKQVILVDEIGQLRKLYSICDMAFVGGTLVNIGGHSLLEPLFYYKTPIFGKYTQNVKDISLEILKRNIGYLVHDKEEFSLAIRSILTEKDQNKIKDIDKLFNENCNIAEKLIERIEKL